MSLFISLYLQIEKQLHDEKTKREEAEKEVENPKKEVQTKVNTSRCNVLEADDSQSFHQDKSSSGSQSSTTEPLIVIEVDQQGKYIRLMNTSDQSSKMLFNTDGKTLNTHLRTLHVLVFLLLLTHSCRGSSQPIVATLGDDIILPCHLVPAEDATDLTLEWTRPDLNPRFVHVWRSGQELVSKKHKSFEGRTSLFLDELKSGNISLKLSKVKIADQGRYRCFIPGLDRQSFVELVVGAVSSPAISLVGIDKSSSGVMLDCRSEGWYPEPEVLWLDGEGNLLSAGAPETVRGPDDLYTVSSRVTVEKRHSNSFTCRVQQKNINQTRETHFSISNDFFNVLSGSAPVITGLAFKKKRSEQQLQEEQQKEVQTLKEELEIKKNEIETKGAELQQLHEEKKRNENELQSLKEELENKETDSQLNISAV
ncbi:butyrophilin subfamily 3 member A2-like [Sebastes fasciatus]|uniref:butyrophilin subfamily 3 member A2-like n=1 Tax=Sebastes fasciatus TaxID=394691 RepID=UPI003D9E0F54